ncbi:hypothetical protein CRG98_046518, partial [Punica granatum]
SHVGRACLVVLLANLSGCSPVHSLLRIASSPSFLARAFCKSAGPARPCTLPLSLCNFAESARSCFMQIRRDCSPKHTIFYASQVRRALSFVLLAHLSDLLDHAHSLLRLAISPSLLARASSKSVEPARSCTLSFMLRMLAEPVWSCISQICRAAPPCTLFYASQVRRAFSLVLSANLPGLLAHAHSLFRFAISPSLLARASCKSVGTARPCTLSFMLRMLAEPVWSCISQICRAAPPCTLFYASQVRRAFSLVLSANLPGLLAHAHSLFRFAISPSLLARASCKSVGTARPCTLSFMLRMLAEPVWSCISQICRAAPPCTLFYASQVRRAFSLVLSANLPGLLAHAHSLFRFAISPSLLARASCKSVGTARPCTLSFMLRMLAEPVWSCISQICRAAPPCTLFYASQVRRAFSLVLSANLPGLLAHAHSLFRFAISPSLLARASCKSVGTARPCTLSFMLRMLAEPVWSCISQICRAAPPCTLFYASQVRRAFSLVLSANLPGLLAHAHSLFRFAISPSLLARASCKSVGTARPCTLSFMLRMLAEPVWSCISQICRAAPPCTLFYASQVRRAFSLVLSANLPGLLAHAHSLFRFAISPSLLARASCKSVGTARPCTLSFMLRMLAEPVWSCISQICRAAPPCTLFYASQVRRAFSLVLSANLPGLLAHAHSLFRFAISPSLLARASCKSVGTARPCTLSFMLRMLAEPVWSCISQICRAAPPCTLFYASQVRRAFSLVLSANLPGLLAHAHSLFRFAISPSLLARASCKSVGTARPCTLSFMLRMLAEPVWSCISQICRAAPPCTLFYASQVRRAFSLVLSANLPGLLAHAHSLFRFAISPSLLARASCKSVGTARPCTLSFMLRKFAEPSHSCFLHICRTCSTIHTLFYALQFRRACSL